ncbi:MAG: hypothetical protein ABSH33_14015 [Steroidobacteraceae bacterium]|jgi:hypothetical protein
MVQQSVAGPFYARHLGSGVWQLTTGVPAGPEIFLCGARPDEPGLLSGESITALGVEWRADGVRVALSGAHGVRHLSAGSAIVHEPAPRLYEAVPLAVLDAEAKRFWRRVFWLMRIPGGRLLLRFLARGGRGRGNVGR